MALAHVNGTALFYTEVGRGAPCFVMHGGLGVDHTQFREWLDPLGDVLHLVYYDHRGNGRSGRPPIETLTHDQLVADADGLRAHLGLDTIAVLGHSYGGCLALMYALRYPRRVSHLLLVGTTAAWDYFDDLAADLGRRAPSPEVVQALLDLPTSDEEMARNQRAIAPVAFHSTNVALVGRVLDKTVWNAAANVRSRQLAADYNVRSRLGEIVAPSLILTGRDDFFCPPTQAEQMHRGIRGSAMVIFERSGHYPFAEENAAFQNAVRAWLYRHALHRASQSRLSPGT
jgi:proline iminopeptidase